MSASKHPGHWQVRWAPAGFTFTDDSLSGTARTLEDAVRNMLRQAESRRVQLDELVARLNDDAADTLGRLEQ